jgi:hypothetical protein
MIKCTSFVKKNYSSYLILEQCVKCSVSLEAVKPTFINAARNTCSKKAVDSYPGTFDIRCPTKSAGYGLDDWEVGVQVPVGSRFFTSPCCPDRLCGPPNLLYNGYGGSFLRVKRPGREADHSPPTSAEVKKMWIYTSTCPYAFMA